MIAKNCNEIFEKAIDDFHVTENVNTPMSNPYDEKSLKCDV